MVTTSQKTGPEKSRFMGIGEVTIEKCAWEEILIFKEQREKVSHTLKVNHIAASKQKMSQKFK